MTGGQGITWSLPVELIDAIADRVATIVTTEINTTTTATPYMTVAEAAGYLRWSKERIYKLTAARAIPHHKHEGRILCLPVDVIRTHLGIPRSIAASRGGLADRTDRRGE